MSLRDYASKGYGAWAVFVQGVEPMAGYAGIVSAARRADPEIIYALQPQWWRQGLAGELIPALLEHGFSRCRLPRIVATVAPGNIASCRAVERAGMHCAGEEIEPDGSTMLSMPSRRRRADCLNQPGPDRDSDNTCIVYNTCCMSPEIPG